MAKDTTKNVPTAPAASAFDLASLVPAGLDANKLEKVGGLTPLYVHEDAWEYKYPPVAGWIMGIECLDAVEEFDAYCLRVEVTSPTKGSMGKSGNREPVDVPVGKEILVPINGSLRNNKDLLRAATDRHNYYFGVIRLTGQMKVNKKPSEMWVYEVHLIKEQPQKREGTRFQFRTEDRPMLAKTGDGTVYDLRTGEVVESTIPRAIPQSTGAQASA